MKVHELKLETIQPHPWQTGTHIKVHTAKQCIHAYYITASCPPAMFFSPLLTVRNLQLNIFSWLAWWVNGINALMVHLANNTPLAINVMGAEC